MTVATLDPKQAYRHDFALAETMTAGTAGYVYNDAGTPKFAPATSAAALDPTDFGDRRRVKSAHVLATPTTRGTIVAVFNSHEGADTGELKVIAIDLENDTEGAAVTVSSDTGIYSFDVCYLDKSNGKGAIAYTEDASGWDVTKVRAFTVSGTTITLGTAIQVSPASHNTTYPDCVAIDTDVLAVCYRDITAAHDNRVAIVTCATGTGTTLTEQDDQSFYSTSFASYLNLAKVDTNKFVIAYMAGSYAGRSKIGTWSAPNLTFGSEYVYDNPAYSGHNCVQVAANKFVIMYGRASDTVIRVGSVLGSAISYGARETLASFVSYLTDLDRFQDVDNTFVCAYRDSSDTYLRSGSVSGTAIALGEATAFAAYIASYVDTVGLTSAEFWWAWYEGASATCWYQTASGGVLPLGINRACGVLEVSGSAGDVRNVTLLGGISGALTGLTPGARYWVQPDDGSIDTVESQFPFGIAFDTAEFFVFRGVGWGS